LIKKKTESGSIRTTEVLGQSQDLLVEGMLIGRSYQHATTEGRNTARSVNWKNFNI